MFELEEISAFEVPKELRWPFVSGQAADCNEQPDPGMRKYPDFISDRPLYGSVPLPYESRPNPSVQPYHFAIDETTGTGQGYDRLYFDLDRDMNLTNDAPFSLQDHPPKGATLDFSWIKQQVYFNCIDVPFDFGTEGRHPLDILPRLIFREDENPLLTFVTTTARRGQIEIAGHQYDAWLGHVRRITGAFDHTSTGLLLIPDGGIDRRGEWYPEGLRSAQKIGREYYFLSATPMGDRLIVRPYKGKYGTFQIGPGNRKIRTMKFNGWLYSDRTDIPVGGKPNEYGKCTPAHRCRVPIGDYTPGLEIYLDRLHVTISRNIHSDGNRMGRLNEPGTFAVKIRKDEPYVFDFSNKPDVMFVKPARNHHVKLGEELRVEAVLIDPVLDVRFTDIQLGRLHWEMPELFDLDDLVDSPRLIVIIVLVTTGLIVALCSLILRFFLKKLRRFFLVLAVVGVVVAIVSTICLYVMGRQIDYQEISPSVAIKRANGQTIASGLMPFG